MKPLILAAAAALALSTLAAAQVKLDGTPAELADRLARTDPKLAAHGALQAGDDRPLAVCGYICLAPGPSHSTRGQRVIPGTTDAPANATVARLNRVAYSFAARYNRLVAKLSERSGAMHYARR
jgi:hypothetical protein